MESIGVQDARLLKKDTAEFRIGLSFSSDLHNYFQKPDLNRRLGEVPSLTLNVGLGKRVEGQFLYSFLYLVEDATGTKWGSGDMTFGFKVRLLEGSSSTPSLAVNLATKLPNAEDHTDFGTDASNVFFNFLVTHQFSHFTGHLNLGLAIIGAPPGFGGGQDDLLKYGLGFVIPLYPDKLDFLLSLEGLTFEDVLNERGALRGGVQVFLDNYVWDIGGSFGYALYSEEWSIRTGVTIPFSLPSNW